MSYSSDALNRLSTVHEIINGTSAGVNAYAHDNVGNLQRAGRFSFRFSPSSPGRQPTKEWMLFNFYLHYIPIELYYI